MDYNKMSDAEIGRRVANACNQEGGTYYNGSTGRWTTFDPCNNPADAWPIITSNRIGITPGTATDKWAAHHGDWGISIADINPLRAAMIVYLQMQESANVQGNPA